MVGVKLYFQTKERNRFMEFTIGNSENVVKAINVANEMKVNTLIICGYNRGKLKQVSKNSVLIRSNDIQLKMPNRIWAYGYERFMSI